MVTLFGITLLLMLVGVIREGLREGLGINAILRMIPYVVPVALQPSIPATILIATCSVYGRMSADNEVVATKSLGISPKALLRPALIVGFLVSLVAVWINDLAPSWGRTGIYTVVIESVEEVVYRMLRTQKSYGVSGFWINVRDVQDRTLLQPHIDIRTSGNSPSVTINAREAELRSNKEKQILEFHLRDGIVEIGDSEIMDFRNTEHVFEIPLINATRKGNHLDSPSLVPMHLIPSETTEQRKRTGSLERLAASQAAYQLMTADFASLAEPGSWNSRNRAVNDERTRLHRLKLEPYRRWATGFSCFFFVLVGAPLAIQMKNSNFFVTFAAVFLPILIIYYPLLAFSVDRAKDGAVPPYAVWIGNLALLLVGIGIQRRVIRY